MFAPLTLAISLFLIFAGSAMPAGTADVVVINLATKGEATLPLGSAGKVELRRDETITRARMELDRVQPPSSRGAAFNTYVAWAVSPEGAIENIGELALDKDKAHLETTSHFEQVGILITAEPHYLVDRPSSAVVWQSQDPKSGSARRVNVQVETGAYDYSAIKVAAQPAGPPLVMEARAAFQIAQGNDNERWAQSELRLARVALDTMEEILERAAPVEILAQSANETIRRSQQVIVVARQRSAASALASARAEGAALKQDKASLESRLQQAAQEQSAANAQIQKLQKELATSNEEKQQFGEDLAQSRDRERGTARDLSELRKKLDDLQILLSLRLRDEFYAVKTKALTPAGREALARLSGIAVAVQGPIHLEGPASDALYEAASQYLVQAGIPQERIVIVR